MGIDSLHLDSIDDDDVPVLQYDSPVLQYDNLF